MRTTLKIYIVFIACAMAMCQKPYTPPAITSVDNNFLVVDGVINTEPGTVTSIALSRAVRLVDTVQFVPELRAQLQIVSDKGAIYPLREAGQGKYNSDPLVLNAADKYQLKITTANGGQYISDAENAKANTPIDSLTWAQEDDVTIYAYTHDPSNTTRYYRWDFVETWEHHADNEAIWGAKDTIIFLVDSLTQIFKCWQTAASNDIVLGTSIQLAQDVISRAPITLLPNNGSSTRVSVRYSILVSQYALTDKAYQYWQILQKNTQQTGGIFDAQPSQLHGNYRSLSNPNEPVIGYLTICAVKQKRLFIDNRQVSNWKSINKLTCDIKIISQDPNNFLHWTGTDTTYAPYYFVSGGGIATLKKDCLDCRRRGGNTIKPSFW